ncbi:DUF4118 domain-containing protein [Streptomyces sp. NPDC001832]|uniref:DUF4118 domain-containing protein n=1 Tax=Streptomyces sp. NPDC001832 TaxID=3154527 RepID=UPI00331D5AC9
MPPCHRTLLPFGGGDRCLSGRNPRQPAARAGRQAVLCGRALTGEPEGEHVLRRAVQFAADSHAQLIGVHVREPTGLVEPDPPWLEGQRRLLTELGGRYAQIAGTDVAQAILDFAEAERSRNLVLGASRRTPGYELLHGSVISRAVHRAGPDELHVIPFRRPPKRPLTARLPHLSRHRRVPLPPRRAAVGWLLAVVAPLAVAVALLPARATLGLAGALFCTLLAVVLTAVVGGIRPAVTATLIGFLAADVLYTRPYHNLRIGHLIDPVALLAFAVVGATVGLLIDILARRGLQVARSQNEAENLARLVADVIADGPGPRRSWWTPCAAPSTRTPSPSCAPPKRAGRPRPQRAAHSPPLPTKPRSASSSPTAASL